VNLFPVEMLVHPFLRLPNKVQIMYKYALPGIWKQKRRQLLPLFRHHSGDIEAVQ